MEAKAQIWLTKTEIADHFRCDVRTIGNLMKSKILPFTKIRGLLRFELADCEQAMRQYRTATLSERKKPAASATTETISHPVNVLPPPSTVPGTAARKSLGAVVAQEAFQGADELKTGVTAALEMPDIAQAEGGTWMLLIIPSASVETRGNKPG